MNLLYHVLFLVASSNAANALVPSGPYQTPAPTLIPRVDPPATTAPPTGYFMTTKYETIAGITQDHVTVEPVTIAIAFPTCIQTITPDINGYVPPGTCGALYSYYPSLAGAAITTGVFAILTGLHIWLAAKWKAVSITIWIFNIICWRIHFILS